MCEDEHTKRNMLLPIAEKMIQKFINENKIESDAEVSLYLMVLEMQYKYKDALEVVSGTIGKVWYTEFLTCYCLVYTSPTAREIKSLAL